MVSSGQRNGFNCVSRRADLGKCAIKLLLVGTIALVGGIAVHIPRRAVRDLLLCAKHLFVEAQLAGSRAAINKVMKQQPAAFLKLLVLLVPREMKGARRAHARRCWSCAARAIGRPPSPVEG